MPSFAAMSSSTTSDVSEAGDLTSPPPPTSNLSSDDPQGSTSTELEDSGAGAGKPHSSTEAITCDAVNDHDQCLDSLGVLCCQPKTAEVRM